MYFGLLGEYFCDDGEYVGEEDYKLARGAVGRTRRGIGWAGWTVART